TEKLQYDIKNSLMNDEAITSVCVFQRRKVRSNDVVVLVNSTLMLMK
ncbi:MAG: hypothetical protein ACI8RD_013480, partial [Bacillariaceae sp.]